MARGWESKSVESQMDEAEERRVQHGQAPDALWVRRQTERNSIELSRERIRRELAEATDERRRAQLRAALEHLDNEFQKMG